MCKIITYDIPQLVKVRKYEVDVCSLKDTLRKSKLNSGLSNRQISDKLKIPLTKVEHWFRTDNCFAIPDAEIWLDLKNLLNIKDDKYDKSIMEFEEKIGVYEKSNRVYDINGISPTITSTDAFNIKIIVS